MKKLSAVGFLVMVMFLMFSVPAAANKTDCLAGDFTDLEGHWAYDQMSELIAMGILKGYPETVYDQELRKNVEVQAVRPEQKITRAEFAALLAQALNLASEREAAPFPDKIPSWAADAVNALFQAGIVKGNPDGSFRPEQKVTRAEITAMLIQALNDKTQQTGKFFLDVPTRHWAYKQIQKASAMGIVNGLPNGKFAPDRGAARAEVMVMLYQFLIRDQSQAPGNQTLLAFTNSLLQAMEAEINKPGPVSLASVSPYLTGEQEAILADGEKALNDLKEHGTLKYQVTYPGAVVRKSDRWAEVVYETLTTFKNTEANLAQQLKEHYYLMKIRDRWYLYSNMDERLL